MPGSVTFKFHASLRKKLKKKELEIELTGTVSVQDILDRLRFNQSERLLILINGIHGSRDQTLNPGDTVSLFPVVGGG